ncbi:MAG: hypothetical protein NUV61_01245 [Candidatus Azambacteria bacterium]|nr:hypothetical protein [Candidatus Azambacteria bacterium]
MDSRLEEFEKKLYTRKEDEAVKRKEYETYKEEDATRMRGGWEKNEPASLTIGARKIRLKSIAVLVFVALSIGAGYYLFTREQPFDSASVRGGIEGPARVSSGDEISYTVTYRNNTNIPLRGAKIVFTWPEGAVVSDEDGSTSQEVQEDIGMIVPGQEKSVTFKGRIYGVTDEQKMITVVFRYTPENVAAEIEDKKTLVTTIVTTPIALIMQAPEQAVSGKEIEIAVEYQNQSDAPFSNMELRVVYPGEFTFVSADPAPTSGNTVWTLGAIDGRESGRIKIKGSFSGAQGEVKSIYLELGVIGDDGIFVQYARADSTITIASSALFVFLTANDSRDYTVNPGAPIQFKVHYKNTTNVQIPNVTILASVDNTNIDIQKLAVQWGVFDGRANAIVWNPVSVPELAVLDPKEEGVVSFSVPVKPGFLPKSFSDKNLTVVARTRITAVAQPESLRGLPLESEDTVSVKINTQFSFNEKAYFQDGLLLNSGPLPPTVGQRTTFGISWQLSSTINDVDGIEVTAVIPSNVEWTGKIYPQDANISFDPNNGIIRWKPGKVFAGTGTLISLAKVDFQLAFTPAEVHIGQVINLISGATLKAVDTFTGTEMERQVSAVTTSLLGSLKGDQGRVVGILFQ